jgi:hypothetical protein
MFAAVDDVEVGFAWHVSGTGSSKQPILLASLFITVDESKRRSHVGAAASPGHVHL